MIRDKKSGPIFGNTDKLNLQTNLMTKFSHFLIKRIAKLSCDPGINLLTNQL